MYSERVYELVNRFMRFLPVFRGFYGFSRFFNFHDPQIKKQKIENFRFSQNRFKIYLDGQYGYKTCLGHQGDPFCTIYHHIGAPGHILKKFNFCSKRDFGEIFEILICGSNFDFSSQSAWKYDLMLPKPSLSPQSIPKYNGCYYMMIWTKSKKW